jgi:hypothetical protein
MGLLAGLTLAVLGPEACTDYARRVVPHLNSTYSSAWPNSSLVAFWNKLFNGKGTGRDTISLWHNPTLARGAAMLTCLTVAATVALVTLRARSRAGRDLAFGLGVTGMLLVSPITWPHYTLQLLLPMSLLLLHLPRQWLLRIVLYASLTICWIPLPFLYWIVLRAPPTKWGGIALQPWQTLTVFSLQTYALVALFVLGIVAAQAAGREADPLPSIPGDDKDEGLPPLAR